MSLISGPVMVTILALPMIRPMMDAPRLLFPTAWREWKRTAVRFATDNSARRGGQRCALRRPVPATDEKQPQVRRITLLLR